MNNYIKHIQSYQLSLDQNISTINFIASLFFLKNVSQKLDLQSAELSINNNFHEMSIDNTIDRIDSIFTKLQDRYSISMLMLPSVILKTQQSKDEFLKFLKVFLDIDSKIIQEIFNEWLEWSFNEFLKYDITLILPKPMNQLLIDLLDIQHSDVIFDPCCYTGNLLIEASKHTKEIYPNEENYVLAAICEINFFMNNITKTITNYSLLSGEFQTNPKQDIKPDIAISVPIFGDTWNYYNFNSDITGVLKELYPLGIPKSSEIAYISRMLATVKDKGKVIVIVPTSFLSRPNKDGIIRQNIIDHGYLDAVIQLPERIFHKTNMSTCILIFDKSRNLNSPIFFIDASKDFVKNRKNNTLAPKQFQKIPKVYHRKEEIPYFSCYVSVEEIKRNNYNLNIVKYIKLAPKRQEIDLVQLQRDVEILEKEVWDLQKKLKDKLSLLKKY